MNRTDIELIEILVLLAITTVSLYVGAMLGRASVDTESSLVYKECYKQTTDGDATRILHRIKCPMEEK